MLVSALKLVKDKQNQSVCGDNLRNLNYGLVEYSNDNRGLLTWGRWTNATISDPETGLDVLVRAYGWDDLIREYYGGNIPSFNEQAGNWWKAEEALEIMRCPASSFEATCLNANNSLQMYATYAMPARTENNSQAQYIAYHKNSDYQDTTPPIRRHVTEVNAPSETVTLSENDSDHTQVAIQGYSRTLNSAAGQVDPGYTGGSNPASGNTNNTLVLHPNSKVNYLLADGRVKAYEPEDNEMIGSGNGGTRVHPQGIWAGGANPMRSHKSN